MAIRYMPLTELLLWIAHWNNYFCSPQIFYIKDLGMKKCQKSYQVKSPMFLISNHDHGHLAGVMQGDRLFAGLIIEPEIVQPKRLPYQIIWLWTWRFARMLMHGEDLSFNFSDNSVVNSIILLKLNHFAVILIVIFVRYLSSDISFVSFMLTNFNVLTFL